MPRLETCEINFFDEKKVSAVRQRMKSEQTIQGLSNTFKVLGDPTRIRLIFALSLEELCVCDIANLLRTTKSAVSHQLRILRNMGLVAFRKEGKMAYYSLTDEHIRNLFDEGLRHLEENAVRP